MKTKQTDIASAPAAIVNAKLILENGILWDGALTFRGGVIAQVGRREEVSLDDCGEIIDARGRYLAPGLVDIHCHGAGLWAFHEDPVACSEHFLRHGETTVLPTFYHNLSLEDMLTGGEKIRQASRQGAGRIMDGLYMEGPYMDGGGSFLSSIKWHGGIRAEEYTPLVDGLRDLVRVWAIDPEREGIEPFMAYCKQVNPGVRFAIGHSRAPYETCERVAKYGLHVRTHMGDGGTAIGRVAGLPSAGPDEYTMNHPDMYAELICDQEAIHVAPGLMRLYVRAKGIDKMILISDSMNDKSEGRFKNDPKRVPFGPDLNYDDTGWLAGSHLTLDHAVHNMMTHTGYGLCHAIRMASLNPARFLGIGDRVGSLVPGKTANLLIIDDMANVEAVFLQGDLMVDNR